MLTSGIELGTRMDTDPMCGRNGAFDQHKISVAVRYFDGKILRSWPLVTMQ
jgi:hypothetical protein